MNARSIYQKYLRDSYESRRARNINYSLRAFARDLGVASSKLTQYLNGDCGISAERASEISKRLQLSRAERELFICSAEAAHSRRPASKEKAAQRLKELLNGTFSEINMEKFNLIRDWYHMAILELTEVSTFESSIAWVADAIGIDESRVKEAVERLERLGLLDTKDKKWIQTERDFETPPEFSSRAIREYHKQMIGLMEERMESVPIDKRELGSVIFAVDEELVPELKLLVREFQKNVATLIDRSPNKNTLYALNTQLMPILQGE